MTSGARLTIPTIAAGDVGNNSEVFFERFGDTPVIVRGAFPPAAVPTVTPATAARWLRGQTLRAVDHATQQHVPLAAEAFFAGLRQGDTRYSVVDHSTAGTPFGEAVRDPAVLQWNWLADPLAASFPPGLRGWWDRSLVASAAGTYTPLHTNSYGLSGWMYLCYGHKVWHFYPPQSRGALYDPLFKDFYDPRLAVEERGAPASAGDPDGYASRFPLAPLVRDEERSGVLRGGELMVFPGGWMHRVETLAESLGFGGGVLNRQRVVDATRWWLVDRSLGFRGTLDLEAFLEHRLAALTVAAGGAALPGGDTSADVERVAQALRLCRRWAARTRGEQ